MAKKGKDMLGVVEKDQRHIPNKGYLLAIIILAVASSFLLSAAEAVVETNIYQPRGYGLYNGTNRGWIMSYIWDTTNPRQSMRVAFSVHRPAIRTYDNVGMVIRTDGYFTRDSGWWYIVGNADIEYITVYYPNGSVLANITGESTDAVGMFRDDGLLLVTEDWPYGRYTVNTSIKGPSSGAPGVPVDLSSLKINGVNITIKFDVAGSLNLSLSPVVEANKGNTVNLNGTVYQPNGKVFNNTEVLGISTFSSYDVNISVMLPNGTIENFVNTTTSGDFSVDYTPDQVGVYYVTAYSQTQLGNQDIMGRYTLGRVIDRFVVHGDWPEVGLGFAQTPASILAALLFSFYLRRKGVE